MKSTEHSIPLVSVVMPVYNTAAYVGQAIESILAQTYANFEFIIVDDASSDNSVEVVRSYVDERIRLIINETNQGISRTRNRGMEVAQGKYIAIFDSDDISLPYRLERQVSFLEKNPDFGLVGGGVVPINEQGQVIGEQWRYTEAPEELPVLLLFGNYFAQPAVTLRASVVADQQYDPSFVTAGDYEFWTRVARRSKVWNLPETMIKYRRHTQGITRRTPRTESLRSIQKIASWQLAYLHLQLSEEELLLFVHLIRNSYDPKRMALIRRFKETSLTFTDCWDLLDRILEANEQHRVYNLTACRKVIDNQKQQLAHVYILACYLQADQYDTRLLMQYFFSDRGYRFVRFSATLKLIVKCLLSVKHSKSNQQEI